jgi:hypothetical protein
MQTLKPAAVYFALVFGAGFVLGPIRIFWAAPRFGARTAELMETPILLAVIVLAARWVVRRFAVPPGPSRRLAIGGLALAFVLAMELSAVLALQGLTISQYTATRDPVAGTVYLVSLVVFALMPLLVARA